MARHMRRTRPAAATLSALLLSSASPAVLAEEAATLCSCSPTIITFTLALDQTCDDDDINGNPGIDGSFCFTEVGVAVPAAPQPGPSAEQAAAEAAAAKEEDAEQVRFRELQGASDPVVEVVSVQFLEFDTSGDLTVINQDDTYADAVLADGDTMTFNSASSFLDVDVPIEDQLVKPALVPGGASLIMYGRTAGGTVVRNRFFFMYDMNCGPDNSPINVGDSIGWVTVSDAAGAWPVFCPALPADSPTISPKTNEPTETPSVSPTPAPSRSPVAMSLPPTEPPTSPGSEVIVPPIDRPFSKSGKTSKTPKVYKMSTKATKTSKSVKTGKAKMAKYYDSAEDGQTAGKTAKSTKTAKSAKAHAVYGNEALRTDYVARQSNGASSYGSSLGLFFALATSYLFSRQ